MTNKKFIRQGDVLLKRVASIPQEAVPVPGKTVLAEGESTGHSHRFIETSSNTLYELEGTPKYLEIGQQTVLVHQEHATLTLPEGIYEIVIEKEHDPFEEVTRRVRD